MIEKTNKAFSFIEALCVIAACAILALMASAGWDFIYRQYVRAELDRMQMVVLQARMHAMGSGVEQVISFDPASNAYYYNTTSFELPRGVQFGLRPGIKGPPSSPSKTPKSSITFPGSVLRIAPTGIASSGAVYLTDKRKKVQYALTCAVGQHTFVRLYRYEKDRWKEIVLK